MSEFARELNNILVEAFHNILRYEEETLKRNSRIPLTINEMHMIECIGNGDGGSKTISNVAQSLKITKPSVTVAVNKLVKKGYVNKTNCTKDGRVINVSLTREGEKIRRLHRRYHSNMVIQLECEFSEEEKRNLLSAIERLNIFFKSNIGDDK